MPFPKVPSRLRLPPRNPKHTEERLKLLAGGFQLLAIAIVGAAFIAPLFNATLGAPTQTTNQAAFVAALLEGAALFLLRCIPISTTPEPAKEPSNV